MKVRKRLLVLLAMAMSLLLASAVTSYAADGDVTESHQGNIYAFTYQSGSNYYDATYEFKAPDKVYDRNGYSGAGMNWLSGSSTFTFDSLSTTYSGTTAAGSSYGTTTAAPTQAGSYTVTQSYRVYYRSSSSYPRVGHPVEITVSDDFEIQPRTVGLSWTKTSSGGTPLSWEYDGNAHQPYAAATGLVSPDTCSVTVDGAQTDVGDSYTATAVSLSNYNYALPSDATTTFKITPKTVTFEWDTSNTETIIEGVPCYPYNGEAQSPLIKNISGVISGDDCTVIVKESTKGTDIGEYNAGAELSGEDKGNYTLSATTKRFKITPETVYVKWGTEKLIYDATVQHPEATLAYTDETKTMSEEDSKKVSVKVYSDEACENEVTGKTEVGYDKVYWAKATLTTDDFAWGIGTSIKTSFRIYAKPVTVTLTSEDPITYDGQYHKPEVEIEGVEDGDKCDPVESLDGKTKNTLVKPGGGKTNTIHIDDVNVDTEKGVYHASVEKYHAKVENTNTVAPEEQGYVVANSGLKGDDAHNYKLSATATCAFAIVPLKISLDWYRPAYDEYGDETGGEPVLVDVANGEKLKLVFNGKQQAPVAKIKSELLKTNPETEEPDECTVTISAPRDAIEARTGAYQAADISFSNLDYERDQTGSDYYIVPRPVKLTWDKTETTYNGLEQPCTPSITNVQKNDRGQDYSAGDGIGVVEVSSVIYVPGYHFGTQNEVTDEADSTFNRKTGYHNDDGTEQTGLAEGTIIDATNRTPIDAGTYVMTAAELSDPFNYTLVRINPKSVELEPAVIPDTQEPAYVANHHPIYTIHQYGIQTIDWSNTKVTYNASNQKPVAKVNKSDLQGPDTNEQVIVMIHDDPYAEEDDFVGHCNAGDYDIYVLKGEDLRGIKGERSMNYFIAENAQKMQEDFIINKKALTVTVNDQAISYGDDPATIKNSIRYSGLINGNVNKDDNHNNTNVPGKYTPEDATEAKDVVEGTPTYKASYSKWGKPGTYTISVSGLTSDNYAITYKAGTLTVNDKFTALLAKAKAGSKKGTLYWNGVTGAAKYDIYYAHCNTKKKTYTPKYYKTVGGNKTSTKIKKLKKRNFYKFYVVALDSSGKQIAQSELSHFCTSNVSGKYTNPKSIKASATNVTVSKGGTFKLSAKVKKVKKGKKLVNGIHTTKIRYKSEVPAVATVTPDGTITGVGTGWCRLYVLAANGIWQTVEVNVQ